MTIRIVTILLFSVAVARGDTNTNGPNGIDSAGLGLDGAGIDIGQIELFRPAKAVDYDSIAYAAKNTNPAGVYWQLESGQASPDDYIDDHATTVAQVIIGTTSDKCAECVGVAPGASLYGIGMGGLVDEPLMAATLNRLLRLSGTDLHTVNMSFAAPVAGFQSLDGNSYLTHYVDWSAARYNVLHVVGFGNAAGDAERIPQDTYNGIVVAGSQPVAGETKYRQWYDENATTGYPVPADRAGIALLAPAKDINLLRGGSIPIVLSGTSYAAAHVTGAVALLQQYAAQRVDPADNPRWNSNAQRHEVLKAVLLNSADKDVLDAGGNGWTLPGSFKPLNRDLGTGHVNVRRAVTQFSSGEYDPGFVPLIGWSEHTIGGPGDMLEYVFDQPLDPGLISVTLAWDRRVEHSGGSTFEYGVQFFNRPLEQELNNLNLALVPKFGTLTNAVWESVCEVCNVEHIAFNIAHAGEYKLIVYHSPGGIGDSQHFGLAWWYGNPPAVLGDYNGDNHVDAADYVMRRDAGGSLDEWRAHFGQFGAGAAILPEPNMLWLLGGLTYAFFPRGFRTRRPLDAIRE